MTNLWKCDDGTFDITDDVGEVIYENVPVHSLANAYCVLRRLGWTDEAIEQAADHQVTAKISME